MQPFMFGLGGAEMLIIALYGSGLGLPLGVTPAEQDPLMLRVAPAECLYYTTWAGMGEADGASGNRTEALLAEPEVRRFVEQLEKAFREGVARRAAEERDADAKFFAEAAPLWLKTLLTRPAAVFVSHLNWRGENPPDIQGGAIVNTGEQTIGIRDSLMKLQARHLGEKAKEVEIGGVPFYQFRIEKDAPLITWGVRGRYLLVGVGEGAVEAMFANARTGPPGWLVDLQEQLPVERTSTVTYANLGGLIERGLQAMGKEDAAQARKVVAALGLSNVSSYAAVTGLDEDGFVNRTLLRVEGESRGIFALAEAKPLTAADLAPIPLDSTAACAMRLNSEKVLEIVQSVAREADPHTADQIDAGLDALAKVLGLDLRKDILAGLGETWCIYNSQGEGGLLFTGLTATVDIRDRAKVEKAYKQLMTLAAAALRERDEVDDDEFDDFGRRPPKLKTIEFQGRTIYYLAGLDDFPFAPAWCLTDTHLVASLLPQNIEALLARREGYKPLAEAPDIARVLAAEPGPLSVIYFDTKTLFELLYPMAKIAATAAFNRMAQDGIDVDAAILPQSRTISRHLRPSVTAFSRSERGIELESRKILPGASAGATAPVATALLLPAVQAARQAARRAQSMNNLKQIALAMHNHEATFGEFPAAALNTKEGKPGLSWRVKILPFVEEGRLYEQFRLDEPWDSEHNKKLIERMPAVYRSPASGAPPGQTNYLGVKGADGIFKDGEKGIRIGEVTDGLSNTIMVVEADDKAAVPWTKPDDFDPDDGMKPTADLGGLWRGEIFLAALADGSVHAVSTKIDPAVLKALFTKSGGEAVPVDALHGSGRGVRRPAAPDVFELEPELERIEEREEFGLEPAELVP